MGANVYPLPDISLGGAIHHQVQPAMDFSQTAFTAEAGYQVLPGAWLNAGYTFLDFDGLTTDSQGFHLRLDLLGAWQ